MWSRSGVELGYSEVKDKAAFTRDRWWWGGVVSPRVRSRVANGGERPAAAVRPKARVGVGRGAWAGKGEGSEAGQSQGNQGSGLTERAGVPLPKCVPASPRILNSPKGEARGRGRCQPLQPLSLGWDAAASRPLTTGSGSRGA